MAFYFYLSTKIIMVFITKSYQDLFGVRSYINALLFLGLGMQEILFIALIVLLFFGGKKIPELMKGLGKGVKSFKEGMNGVEDDIDGKDKKGETKE